LHFGIFSVNLHPYHNSLKPQNMEKFQKVKQLIQKEKFKRIFAENIVILHGEYYYKTLNLFGTMMYP